MIPAWLFLLPLNEIDQAATNHNIDKHLVTAMVMVESGGNRFAGRYEHGYKWLHHPADYANSIGISHETEIQFQSISWGLLQVMGATARWMGYKGDLPELCDHFLGLEYGCKYYKWVESRTDSMEDAIAAYNGGMGAIKYKEEKGMYPPDVERHVDKVMRYYREITETK